MLTTDQERRFWARVDRSGDCWLWLGPVDRWGYGFFNTGGRRVRKHYRAHRIAYELARGLPGETLHHLCGNPLCVNPRHLWSLTHEEHKALHDALLMPNPA